MGTHLDRPGNAQVPSPHFNESDLDPEVPPAAEAVRFQYLTAVVRS